MNIDHNKDYNSAAPNRSGNNEQDNNIVDSGKIIYADPCISDELLQPKMKSVRFYGKVKVYRSADPSASDMSTNEKQKRWYNNSEYNQFKHEAASHAGVNIVPCDDPNNKVSSQNHPFVMMGNFDGKDTKEDASSASKTNNNTADTAVSSTTTENHPKKLFYNENEYNDSHDKDTGEVICKRGLGYHFSRERKKSRIVTRSAVMAWQKMLRDPKHRVELKRAVRTDSSLGNSDLNKSRGMLALVSAKCSRVSLEEAKWRGDVDYRVAYPERHDTAPAVAVGASSSSSSSSPSSSMSKKGVDEKENDSTNQNTNTNVGAGSTGKKRSHGEDSTANKSSGWNSISSCKRQRMHSGGCRVNRCDTRYFGGTLRAEV